MNAMFYCESQGAFFYDTHADALRLRHAMRNPASRELCLKSFSSIESALTKQQSSQISESLGKRRALAR